MDLWITKSFLLLVYGYYLCLGFLKLKNKSKKRQLIVLAIFAVLSVGIAYAGQVVYIPLAVPATYVSLLIVMLSAYRLRFGTAYAISTVSLGIVYGIYMVFTYVMAAALVLFKVQQAPTGFLATVFMIIPVLLTGVVVFLIFKIKRFKSGMPFAEDSASMYAGVLIGTVVLLLFCIFDGERMNVWVISASVTILFGTFLFYIWWRFNLTKKYKESLRKQELESLRENAAVQERKIEALTKDNNELSKIVHRDNKLVPAMEYSLRSYLLECEALDPTEKERRGRELLKELSEMSAERKGLISGYESSGRRIKETGIPEIDTVLNYMSAKAEENGVDYKVTVSDCKAAYEREKIEGEDIKTLLADVIENAFVACEKAANKKVLVHVGTINKRFMLRVFDSGAPFDPASYELLGKVRSTTHADSGGSGIGMQTLFNIKGKYRAGIIINEFEPDNGIFTKSVTLVFDKLGSYNIITYRPDEIRKLCHRRDLRVLAK